MKRLLLFIVLLGFASSANAQVTVDFSTARIAGDLSKMGTPINQPFVLGPVTSAPFHLSSPLHHDGVIKYYDDALPTINWVAPADFGVTSFIYGQRITLPTDGGTLDSIRLNFVQTAGNTIIVALMQDTLITLGGQDFRVINLNAQPYAAAQFPATAVPPNSWVTITLDQVAVPKDFFIAVIPSTQGQSITSSFALRGDSKPVRLRTTEDSRSAVVFITSEGLLSLPLDSTITFQGQPDAAYTDFYLEAYPTSEHSSIGRDIAAPASVYPNPVLAGGMLRVNHPEAVSQIRIVNALGAEVSNWNGLSSNVELSMRQIPGGVYHLLITTGSGVTSEKIVVQ